VGDRLIRYGGFVLFLLLFGYLMVTFIFPLL